MIIDATIDPSTTPTGNNPAVATVIFGCEDSPDSADHPNPARKVEAMLDVGHEP